MTRRLIGWIVCDGQTLRLRTAPKRYGGSVLAELRASPAVVQAFDRVDPGELTATDPAIRAGSVDGDRWVLATGRQVAP